MSRIVTPTSPALRPAPGPFGGMTEGTQVKTRAKALTFYSLLLILILVVAGNFVLTPNPWAANLGGFDKVSKESAGWFIAPSLLLGACLLGGIAFVRRIYIHPLLMVAIPGMVVSGVATGVFMMRPQTYILDILGLVFISSLAHNDGLKRALGYLDSKGFDRAKLVAFGLVILGFLMAIASYRYGKVIFGFSRGERTNVTLWNILGFDLWLLPMIFAGFLHRRKISARDLFIALFVLAVITTSYRRTWMVEMYVCVFVFAVLYAFEKKATFLKFVLAVVGSVVLWNIQDLWDLMLLSGASDSTELIAALNGRDQLWPYYYQNFAESPIWGKGAFLLERATDYSGTATSEIGLLKWFTEYGLIFALPMAALFGVALWQAVKALWKTHAGEVGDPLLLFGSLVVVSSGIIFLTNSIYRVQSIEGIVFWYSVFYLVWHGRLQARKAKLVREGSFV